MNEQKTAAASSFPEYELAGIETISRGVFILDGKILLCRAKGGKTTYLPGGHIEFGETGRAALIREMREETGLGAVTHRFLGVVENSFLQHGKPHAEINLVYSMTLETTEPEKIAAAESWIEFIWWPLENLSAANLLPSAFNQLATNPNATFEP